MLSVRPMSFEVVFSSFKTSVTYNYFTYLKFYNSRFFFNSLFALSKGDFEKKNTFYNVLLILFGKTLTLV